jgi:peptide/nickel transport system ATP-binding protein
MSARRGESTVPSGRDAHLRDDALLSVEHLTVEFPTGRGTVHAVSDVSFDIRRGETLGLVGESGCGKSTTGRAVLQLPPPTSGSVRYEGRELVGMDRATLRRIRPELQMILQDPLSSLNPRRRVRSIVGAPLRAWGRPRAEVAAKVREVLDAVGLDLDQHGDRRPSAFSGGQAQRICIARALVFDPSFLLCDEAVSALDVSVQAQILNLLQSMKKRYGLTMLFISHDLAVVSHVSDRIAVMYLGKLCEIGIASKIYARPAHPYTSALLESIPVPDPDHPLRAPSLSAVLPSPVAPPSGCRFRTRCERATDRCAAEEPPMRPTGDDRFVACHHPLVEVAVHPPNGPDATIASTESTRPTERNDLCRTPPRPRTTSDSSRSTAGSLSTRPSHPTTSTS